MESDNLTKAVEDVTTLVRNLRLKNRELKDILKEISGVDVNDHNAVVAAIMMAGDAYREL